MNTLLFGNLPKQKQDSFLKRGVTYNIMVVGAHGTGKTSLMNNLLGYDLIPHNPYCGENTKEIKELHVRSATPPHEIISKPTEINSSCYRRSLLNFQITNAIIKDSSYKLNLTITEVDGVGDSIDNTGCWAPITTLLNETFDDYYSNEKVTVCSRIKDNRIHVCLYLINAVSMPFKDVDITVMREISKQCNLIPILTNYEVERDEEPQKNIYEYLYSEGINVWSTTDPDRKNEIVYPIYKIMKNSGGIIKPSNDRKKKIEPFSKNDSAILKKFLFAKHMLDLIETTKYFYELFRVKKIEKQAFEECNWTDEEINHINSTYKSHEIENKNFELEKKAFLEKKKFYMKQNKK